MRTYSKSNVVTIGVLLIMAIIVFCGWPVFSFLVGFSSYPSNETLAQRYLDAIKQPDIEQAVGLASPGCAIQIRKEAQTEIETYGGAEVRNVDIQARRGTGSDDQIQFVTLTFEYRREGMTDWQQGQLMILTDYDPPGFRHITCGG